MAEIRLSKLTKQYSIGLARLVNFLNEQGACVEMNPNAKVSDKYLPLIEERFGDDITLRRDAHKVTVKLKEIIEMGAHIKAQATPQENNTSIIDLGKAGSLKVVDKIDLSQFDKIQKKETQNSDKKIITSVDFPGGITVGAFEGYKKGILLPQHITSGGEPISMAWLKKHVSRFKVGDILNATVITEYSTSDVAFLTLDIGKPDESLNAIYSTMNIGSCYSVRKVEETPNYYFVEVADFFFKGVILKKQFDYDPWKDSSYIDAQLTDKGTNS